MKKKCLAAAVAASITLSMGVALAAPVEFDGSASVHYRWNDHDVESTSESAKSTVLLNAKLALSDNTDVYARFATQRLHAGFSSTDFDTKDGTRDTISTIDRFGFIYKEGNSTYNFGRQGATIGATALLYSTEGYIGSNMGSIDGLSASAKIGATTLGLIAGQESVNDNRVYSLHGSYNPAEAWTVGGTVARYDRDAGDATNYWAVDAAYNQGKATYFGEYAKSNENTYDKAFAIGTSYAFDAKSSLAVIYSKVEPNGDMNGWTDFDPNGKGLYYSYNYKFSDVTTLNVFYKDMKQIATDDEYAAGTKYNSFRTTVTYKF